MSIWREDCIGNLPGGQCVWAALETMGRHCGLASFEGITRRAMLEGWHGADAPNIRDFFRRVHVEFEEGHDIAFLERAVELNTGAVIFFPGHAVYLTGIDDESVRYIDNNDPEYIRVMSRGRFDQVWQRYACFPRDRHPLRPWLDRPPPGPNPPGPGPRPRPHSPSPNPKVPVEPKPNEPDKPVNPPDKPAPPTEPAPLPVRGEKGEKGDKGDKGDPGTSVDTKALIVEIGTLIDGKLSPLDKRLKAVESKLDGLTGKIDTFFVPGNVPPK